MYVEQKEQTVILLYQNKIILKHLLKKIQKFFHIKIFMMFFLDY